MGAKQYRFHDSLSRVVLVLTVHLRSCERPQAFPDGPLRARALRPRLLPCNLSRSRPAILPLPIVPALPKSANF
jgi:hypothetical protein